MLQDYLRAEPTVSERCSGAVCLGNNVNAQGERLEKAVKQVNDFDNAWKANMNGNKSEVKVRQAQVGDWVRTLTTGLYSANQFLAGMDLAEHSN